MYTMKESVAVAKEADAKKGVSPTRSDNSIHRVRNEPERQLGSLRDVIGNIRRDGGTPSVESIATELSGMHTAQRAPALLALQQTHGNRYVQRVVSGIQAKLKVGQPGDIYEQEADRVADAVMRMPEPRVQRQAEEVEKEKLLQAKPISEQITPLVQRQVEEEEEEELAQPKLAANAEYSIQRQVEEEEEKEEEKEEDLIQTKPIVDQITPLVQRQVEDEEEEILRIKREEDTTPEVAHNLESQIQMIRGGGKPLSESERIYFEPRFGRDFSQVRVHTDTRAANSARAVNARAFTTGRDVVFGAGQYAPGTGEGRKLMAHELTHVVQQTHGNRYVQRVVDHLQSKRDKKLSDEKDEIVGRDMFTKGRTYQPFSQEGQELRGNELKHTVQGESALVQLRRTTSKSDRAEQEAKAVEEAFAGGQPIPEITTSIPPTTLAGNWELDHDECHWQGRYDPEEARIVIALMAGRERAPALTASVVEDLLGLRRVLGENHLRVIPDGGEITSYAFGHLPREQQAGIRRTLELIELHGLESGRARAAAGESVEAETSEVGAGEGAAPTAEEEAGAEEGEEITAETIAEAAMSVPGLLAQACLEFESRITPLAAEVEEAAPHLIGPLSEIYAGFVGLRMQLLRLGESARTTETTEAQRARFRELAGRYEELMGDLEEVHRSRMSARLRELRAQTAQLRDHLLQLYHAIYEAGGDDTTRLRISHAGGETTNLRYISGHIVGLLNGINNADAAMSGRQIPRVIPILNHIWTLADLVIGWNFNRELQSPNEEAMDSLRNALSLGGALASWLGISRVAPLFSHLGPMLSVVAHNISIVTRVQRQRQFEFFQATGMDIYPESLPGGSHLRIYMRSAFRAGSSADVPAPRAEVVEYFNSHRDMFRTVASRVMQRPGPETRRSWLVIEEVDPDQLNQWIFQNREWVWRLLYNTEPPR